jgi:hypothetical protein
MENLGQDISYSRQSEFIAVCGVGCMIGPDSLQVDRMENYDGTSSSRLSEVTAGCGVG